MMEVIYYKKIPNLSNVNTTTWLSTAYPDFYVFGLMTEISSFVKDAEATILWGQRFDNLVNEMIANDSILRWSGTPLQTTVG